MNSVGKWKEFLEMEGKSSRNGRNFPRNGRNFLEMEGKPRGPKNLKMDFGIIICAKSIYQSEDFWDHTK